MPKKKVANTNSCRKNDFYNWNPEHLIEDIMSKQLANEAKWIETGLPALVEQISENYETYGGINHLDGKDLPSKKVIIELLKDILSILFPGYLGDEKLIKSANTT